LDQGQADKGVEHRIVEELPPAQIYDGIGFIRVEAKSGRAVQFDGLIVRAHLAAPRAGKEEKSGKRIYP